MDVKQPYPPTGGESAGTSLPDRDYMMFIENVKKSTGIDLSEYKEAQMKRRLTTLRVKNGYTSFAAFFEAFSRTNPCFMNFWTG